MTKITLKIRNGIYWESVGANLCQLKKGYFKKLKEYYLEEFYKISQEWEPTKYKSVFKMIWKLDERLFRDDVIKTIINEKYQKTSGIKWNQNKDLFAFNNKIYDLSKGCFIDPSPEQYINYTCGYNYEDINTDEEEQYIINFINSILDIKYIDEQKQYLLKVMSSFLRQENKEEVAYFWTGKGRNGKGTLATLLSNSLGKYWGELDIEYYTAYEKSSERPKQNLYNCRNARVINTAEINEVNENDKPLKFISDKFKRITGGDTIVARKIMSEDIAEFKAGKILIQTNTLPEFSSMSISLKERIKIINFPYTFTDNDELLKLNTFYKKRDNSIKDKFNDNKYKTALIKILFKNYKEYLSNFIVPPSIMNETNNYFNNSNLIKQCFNEKYEFQYKTKDEEETQQYSKNYNKIKIKEILNNFINETNKKITEAEFRTALLNIEKVEIIRTEERIGNERMRFYTLIKWIPKNEVIDEIEEINDLDV